MNKIGAQKSKGTRTQSGKGSNQTNGDKTIY
jgi:hypothetical protein